MILSPQQKNLKLQQIVALEKRLKVPVRKGVPAVIAAAEKAQVDAELKRLRGELETYERVRTADVAQLEFTTFEELLSAPIALRLANGLSVERFAEITHVSASQIKRYEKEQYRNAPGAVVNRILGTFGISIKARASRCPTQAH